MSVDNRDSRPPAIAGGKPAFPDGPPDWPGVAAEVSESVARALKDGSWGKYDARNCQQLIELLCETFQFKHALLCSSGTIATEIALRGTNVQSNSEVALAAYDFSGNFRAVDAIQAKPVLVDIERDSWCINAELLKENLEERVSAIIVSHLHGGLADVQRIGSVAKSRGIRIIEDACQSPGAIVNGEPIGRHSDVMTVSFGGSKLLTAGRGGAVLTNRDDVYQRSKVYAQRGNDAFPLSELQAAALIPQIASLAQRNKTRSENVQRIAADVRDFWSIGLPEKRNAESLHAYFKLPWLLDSEFPVSRTEMISALQAEGIAADEGFRGFAKRSSRRCRKSGPMECSKRAAANTIVFHHPILLKSPDEIQRLTDAVRRVYTFFENRK